MKKKIGLLVLSITFVLIILASSTYSLVFKVDESEQENYVTGMLSIVSESTNSEPSFNLNNSLPMSDDEGKNLTPYTFKITNIGDLAFKFDVKLLSTVTDVDNVIGAEYIKIQVNDGDIVTFEDLYLDNNNGKILKEQMLLPGESLDVSLRVWLDEYTTNDQIDKSFNAKVTTEGYSLPTNNPAYITLAKLGLTDSVKYDTPDFSKSSCSEGCEEATVGIYSMKDDLGMSYYFRGDVENNYVKFGKYTSDFVVGFKEGDYDFYAYTSVEQCKNDSASGCYKIASQDDDMYWRIVRINGDGTIRMIYAGIEKYRNGETNGNITFPNSIGWISFNSQKDDNRYVGYMYGLEGMVTGTDDVEKCLVYDDTNSDAINIKVSDTTKTSCEEAGGLWTTTAYEATHANVVDSAIKNYIEDIWYPFMDSGSKGKIADAIYCNDRSLDLSDNSNIGIGNVETNYAFLSRLGSPILTCANSNDRFSYKSSNINGVKTNGKLNAPVGLLTMDEASIAGAGSYVMQEGNKIYGSPNMQFYLNIQSEFYTMTSRRLVADFDYEGYIGFVTPHGTLGSDSYYDFGYGFVVRPVISLKANALQYSETSNGSMEYPFVVEQ